ncbi:hypothetical protein KAJ27_21335 [bacterium]|nr:hypothetical protein [bacterium]
MNELVLKIKEIIKNHELGNENVKVIGIDAAKIVSGVMTPEEAIGKPAHNDYPIITGKEKMMISAFKNSRGVAFTDHYGNFEGTLKQIIEMEFDSNLKRGIFISTINALLKELKFIEKTIHCKNDEMLDCARQVTKWIKEKYGSPKIFLVGFQPRFVEELSENFNSKATDISIDNIGKVVNEMKIQSPDETEKLIEWCDIIFATGSVFTNDSYKIFLNRKKPFVIYGVTGAGPAHLLDLPRFCPCGRDS